MDFLKKYISTNTIEQLKENYSKEILFNFICNDKNIVEVIKYFQSLNITNIEKIMLNNLNIFITDIDEIKSKFNNYNQQELANFISQDVNNIDLIWNE